MDARKQVIAREKDRLLRQLAELQIEEQRLAGDFDTVPHFSVVEQAAHKLGQRLSQITQGRASREIAANSEPTADCPVCHKNCCIKTQSRELHSLDGPIEIVELVAHCSACRRDFFPSA